jgi:hypothetical protein
MLRPIFAFLFLLGVVSYASPAIAAVEAELSGSPSPVLTEAASEMVAESSDDQPVPPPYLAANVTYENNIQVGQPVLPTAPTPVVAANGAPSVQIVNADASEASDPDKRVMLTPMFGYSSYVGRWRYHTTNPATVGLILEAPVSRNFSLEVEGSYAKHGITYSSYSHNFDLYGIGAGGKLYLMKGVLSPYIGAGLMGLYYDGMSRGPSLPFQYYDHWLGSGQLTAGGDIALSREIAIGVRGAYVRPLFNQPATYTNGLYSSPGYEEAAAINTAFWRLMGAVRIAL